MSRTQALLARSALGLVAALLALLRCGLAHAGPPFLTDDPEPIEPGHWELYAASQGAFARDAAFVTAPHLEANYGAGPGVQFHAIVPAAISWARGDHAHYGLGDVEVGVKLRFVDTDGWQLGVFPLITLATGSERLGLGGGRTGGLLPLWLQKDAGAWKTYGGGGYRFAAEGDAVVLGWLVQRRLCDGLALGVEAFATIPVDQALVALALNLGLVADLSDVQHLLLSAGPSFHGDVIAQAYLAYQLTL